LSVLINSHSLRRELLRRGWCQHDLAVNAGISSPTVSAALAGRAVTPRTLKLIATALSLVAPIEGVEELIAAHSPSGNGEKPYRT